MVVRLLLLLVIAGGLVGFAIQNWSPTIALTFLGFKTMALPLAVWVLWAIVVGILTTLAINALFAASNYLAVQAFRTQWRQNARQSSSQPYESDRSSGYASTSSRTSTSASTNPDASWRTWRKESSDREPPQPEPVRDRASSRDRLDDLMDELDDWETPISDDWEVKSSDRRRRPDSSGEASTSASRREYETPQTPKTTSQSGSVYSYGYREPRNSGAGRTEDVQQPERVVDADYRVIIPPYYPGEAEPVPDAPDNQPIAEENADDWFEDTSDDSGDPANPRA
ncbi:hypothetical protein ACN4EK_16845 [Pantanalinema rosaneae CENA516]|uniref:hypothetical protein n=1 Tax=Pantanalinema rosaneae TaxID=1620701 RepID=UPI003D6FF19E